MKKYILIILLFVLAISTDSCKTDDLELTNPNGISTGNFPNTSAELIAGLNAVYAPLQAFGLYARYIPFMLDNMAENTGRAALSGDLRAFVEMTFGPENGDILLYWKNCYAGISRANTLLDNLDKIEQIKDASPEEKNKYIGEIKFLRAHYYFLLVSRFGDIPLYTTNDPNINNGEGFPKSSKEEVYQLIIADLEDAALKLKEKSAETNGRATIGAANSQLGKVYLYRGEYAKAKAVFDKVILSGEYTLTPNFFDNFTTEAEHNSESIFEVEFDYDAVGGNAWAANWGGNDNGTGAEAAELSARSREYGFLGWHNVNPNQGLIDAFENESSFITKFTSIVSKTATDDTEFTGSLPLTSVEDNSNILNATNFIAKIRGVYKLKTNGSFTSESNEGILSINVNNKKVIDLKGVGAIENINYILLEKDDVVNFTYVCVNTFNIDLNFELTKKYNDTRLDATVFFNNSKYGASNNLIVTQAQIGDEKSAWRKYELAYKQDSEGGLSDINHRVIRYADVLLMAAEAENELGNMVAAISLMNQVRDRVAMPNYGTVAMNATYPVGTKAQVFAALVHERQVELSGEQTRFPDLVRWGMAPDQIPNFVAGKHEIFPIPQGEIDTNINLTNDDQNPNY